MAIYKKLLLRKNSINRLIYGMIAIMQETPSHNPQPTLKSRHKPKKSAATVLKDKQPAAYMKQVCNQVEDDNNTRARLLREALRLFAAQGFAKTSTRAIAQAAGVNISAISYYFGNKEGLYRSAYYEPIGNRSPKKTAAQITDPLLSLEQALQVFFEHMFVPFAQADIMCDSVRLNLREVLEPTGLWKEVITKRITVIHRALEHLIVKHLALEKSDDEIQRLVFAIGGIPFQLIVGHEVVLSLCPNLLKHRNATANAVESMVRYSLALIESERQYRFNNPPTNT